MVGRDMFCEKCKKDLSFLGSRVCRICDPDIKTVLERARYKTPYLCETCFEEHLKDHDKNRPH